MGTSRLQKSKCFSGVTFSKTISLATHAKFIGCKTTLSCSCEYDLHDSVFHCMAIPTTATEIASVDFFSVKKTWFLRHTGSMDGSKLWPSNMIQGFLSWKRKKSEQNIITVFLPFSSGWKSINNINLHFLGGGILPMLSHEGPRMEDLYFT